MSNLPSENETKRKLDAEHRRILRRKKYEQQFVDSVARSNVKEEMRKDAHLRIIKDQRTNYLKRAQRKNDANLDIVNKGKGKRVLSSGNTHKIRIFG